MNNDDFASIFKAMMHHYGPSMTAMRTTVTFDPDVKQRLESARGSRAFKEFVNDILRRGLDTLEGDSAR